MLQKSKVASVRIFDETLNREATDDSHNLSRATEVAHEFCVWRCGPSNLYMKNAPTALRIFDTFGKTTFATLSGRIADIAQDLLIDIELMRRSMGELCRQILKRAMVVSHAMDKRPDMHSVSKIPKSG